MFRITSSKGFHLELPNGVVISTQFGGGNYCDNYPKVQIGDEKEMGVLESKDAEIAIWIKNGPWITDRVNKKVLEDNQEASGKETMVLKEIDMEDWLKVLEYCKNLDTTKILL